MYGGLIRPTMSASDVGNQRNDWHPRSISVCLYLEWSNLLVGITDSWKARSSLTHSRRMSARGETLIRYTGHFVHSKRIPRGDLLYRESCFHDPARILFFHSRCVPKVLTSIRISARGLRLREDVNFQGNCEDDCKAKSIFLDLKEIKHTRRSRLFRHGNRIGPRRNIAELFLPRTIESSPHKYRQGREMKLVRKTDPTWIARIFVPTNLDRFWWLPFGRAHKGRPRLTLSGRGRCVTVVSCSLVCSLMHGRPRGRLNARQPRLGASSRHFFVLSFPLLRYEAHRYPPWISSRIISVDDKYSGGLFTRRVLVNKWELEICVAYFLGSDKRFIRADVRRVCKKNKYHNDKYKTLFRRIIRKAHHLVEWRQKIATFLQNTLKGC